MIIEEKSFNKLKVRINLFKTHRGKSNFGRGSGGGGEEGPCRKCVLKQK